MRRILTLPALLTLLLPGAALAAECQTGLNWYLKPGFHYSFAKQDLETIITAKEQKDPEALRIFLRDKNKQRWAANKPAAKAAAGDGKTAGKPEEKTETERALERSRVGVGVTTEKEYVNRPVVVVASSANPKPGQPQSPSNADKPDIIQVRFYGTFDEKFAFYTENDALECRGVSTDQFDSLKPGMSQAEVFSLLGVPVAEIKEEKIQEIGLFVRPVYEWVNQIGGSVRVQFNNKMLMTKSWINPKESP